MKKYRIRPVSPNQWAIERKGWFFWHHLIWDGGWAGDWKVTQATFEDARLTLDDYLKRERETKAHLATPATYVTEGEPK